MRQTLLQVLQIQSCTEHGFCPQRAHSLGTAIGMQTVKYHVLIYECEYVEKVTSVTFTEWEKKIELEVQGGRLHFL